MGNNMLSIRIPMTKDAPTIEELKNELKSTLGVDIYNQHRLGVYEAESRDDVVVRYNFGPFANTVELRNLVDLLLVNKNFHVVGDTEDGVVVQYGFFVDK